MKGATSPQYFDTLRSEYMHNKNAGSSRQESDRIELGARDNWYLGIQKDKIRSPWQGSTLPSFGARKAERRGGSESKAGGSLVPIDRTSS
jgi:hypothetical protein